MINIARKKRPENIQSKEVLKRYLDSNPSELPFVEDCWNAAVVESNAKNKIIKVENAKPGVRAKKLTSPGSVYFELLSTPIFQEQAETAINNGMKLSQHGDSIAEIDVKDYIDNLNSQQGQFIYKALTQYFGTFQSESAVKFVVERIKNYYGEYELNSASDEFLVMTAITDELVMRDFTQRRVIGKSIDNKELETIRNGYMKSLDGLKALKKLDTSNKEKDNKFTVWVDKLMKNEKLSGSDIKYEKDEIDRLAELQLEGIRGVFSG